MLNWDIDQQYESFFGQGFIKDSLVAPMALCVLARDNYSCSCCGLVTRPSSQIPTGFFQIKALDKNYASTDESNYVAICPFCHATDYALQSVVSGRFRMIVAPWISQAQVSLFSAVALSILSDESHPYFPDALAIYQQLMSGETLMSSYIEVMPKTQRTRQENIALFCQNLLQVDKIYDAVKSRWVKPLRIVPDKSAFTVECDYFRQASLEAVPLKYWERMIQWKINE